MRSSRPHASTGLDAAVVTQTPSRSRRDVPRLLSDRNRRHDPIRLRDRSARRCRRSSSRSRATRSRWWRFALRARRVPAGRSGCVPDRSRATASPNSDVTQTAPSPAVTIRRNERKRDRGDDGMRRRVDAPDGATEGITGNPEGPQAGRESVESTRRHVSGSSCPAVPAISCSESPPCRSSPSRPTTCLVGSANQRSAPAPVTRGEPVLLSGRCVVTNRVSPVCRVESCETLLRAVRDERLAACNGDVRGGASGRDPKHRFASSGRSARRSVGELVTQT